MTKQTPIKPNTSLTAHMNSSNGNSSEIKLFNTFDAQQIGITKQSAIANNVDATNTQGT